MEDTAKKTQGRLQASLLGLVYSPVKLRVALTLTLLASWYYAIATPRVTEIDETTRRIEQTQQRLQLAREIESLRKQVAQFKDRIPKDAGPNEWLQYMLAGSRQFRRLKLESVDTTGVRDAKPYKAVIMRVEVEGPFREVESFVRWLESNPRLLRLDSLSLSPVGRGSSSKNKMRSTLLVLGMNG